MKKRVNDFEIRICPSCGIGISVIKNKIQRHERGLSYIPYNLYKKIERLTGMSVKEQAKKNLCNSSGDILLKSQVDN